VNQDSAVCSAGDFCVWVAGAGFVELADAVAVWIARDLVRASVGIVPAEQDFVWRVSSWRWQGAGKDVGAADEGALGWYERRGAGEVPGGDAGEAGMVLSAACGSGWVRWSWRVGDVRRY
jgi:hypothetical protein